METTDSAADLARLAREAGRLALTASQLLGDELQGEADVKRAKDLASIMKDMAALAQSLRGAEPMELTVLFAPEAGEAAV